MKRNKILLIILCLTLILGTMTGCFGKQEVISAGEMLYGASSFGEKAEPIVSDAATMYSEYISFKITDEEFQARAEGLSERATTILTDYQGFKEAYAVTGADDVYTTAMTGMLNALTLTKALVDEPGKKELEKREDYLNYYVKMMNLINENLDIFKVCATQIGEEK